MITINKESGIWVYGYNNVGRNAYNILKEIYGSQVRGIIESKKKHKVTVEISETIIADDDIVFICANPKFHSGIKEKIKNGIVYAYTEEIDSFLIKKWGGKEDNLLIENRLLAISVGQACSLKCKDCANFSPYAQKQNLRYDIEKIKDDISNTLLYFSNIDVIHIQGGEPFVYSQLVDLIDYIIQNYRHIFQKIQIATNGTIIPSCYVLDYISTHKDIIEIRISNYPQIKTDIFIETLEKWNIKYRIYDFAGRNGEWILQGGIDYIDMNNSLNYLMQKVYDCPWCSCFTMENGRIGRCARSIPSITLQNIPIYDGDYLEIGKSNAADFRSYFMFIKAMECCNYCAGGYGEKIVPAEQLQCER